MTNPIAHLSERQINELIERYYAGEKTSILLNEFNVKIQPSQLVRILPPEVLKVKCEYCENSIVRNRLSRDSPSWRDATPYCPVCYHKPGNICDCENCEEKRKNKKEEKDSIKRNLIRQIGVTKSREKVDFDNLDLTDKTYVGAFLREGLYEDYNEIKSVETFMSPLAPTAIFTIDMVKKLTRQNIIYISEDTYPDYIEILDENQGSYNYYIYKVKWRLNVFRGEMNKVPLIESIINPTLINVEDNEEALTIWKKIALYEVLEYLEYSINNILDVDYKVGEKTLGVISDLLNSYSVSQIYGIIYSTVNSALRFQKERGVSKSHAANTIVSNAQSYGERAKIEKWNLRSFTRIKELPQSALSKFFFERVIKIGRFGFEECPKLEIIERVNNLED